MKLESFVKGLITFVVISFIIILTLFIKSCSEPYCKEEYCESFDEEYEKRLEQTAPLLKPFPQNLTPKPIFVQGNDNVLYLPYVYIKDRYGVWLRYKNNNSIDYFLQKEMPKDYYLYTETHSSIKKNPRYYSENSWYMSLSENGNIIYQQSAHCVTRQDITYFDLHSNAGSTHCFPKGIGEHRKNIKELQATIIGTDFPEETNSGFSIKNNINQYGKVIGHKIIKAENNNIFEINTDEGIQKIRTHFNPSYVQKMVCAKEFCLLFVTKPDSKYCGEIDNETNVYVIRTDKKFSKISVSNAFAQSNDCWVTHFGLKDGYTADDIASFILIPTEFEYIPKKHEEKRKGEKINQHRLLVYTRDGTVINQYCDWYFPCRAVKTLSDE